MARRVFVAYPCDFPKSDTVDAVCDFLVVNGCTLTIPPECGWTYYSSMEEAIERCDAFVSVLDPLADGSSQLASHLEYAASLQRIRWNPRPRIHGLWLGPPREVGLLASRPVEIIRPGEYEPLLEDLPPRY